MSARYKANKGSHSHADQTMDGNGKTVLESGFVFVPVHTVEVVSIFLHPIRKQLKKAGLKIVQKSTYKWEEVEEPYGTAKLSGWSC